MNVDGERHAGQGHARLFGRTIRLSVVAGMAASHQVLPGVPAAARTRQHVIEREFVSRQTEPQY